MIPASIILCLIILVCIFGNRYVKGVCKDLKSDLNSCIDLYENSKKTESVEYADKINSKWQKDKNILSIFVNHSFIDQITVSANALPYYLSLDSKDLVYGEYSNISVALRHISNEHSVTADNFY